MEINESQESKIKFLEESVSRLQALIAEQNASNQNAQKDMAAIVETKFNRNTGVISLIVGSAALIVAILQFFL